MGACQVSAGENLFPLASQEDRKMGVNQSTMPGRKQREVCVNQRGFKTEAR